MKKHLHRILFVSVLLGIAPVLGWAKDVPPTTITQPALVSETDLKEHKHYTNKQGDTVHSPAHSVSGAPPSGASAQCRDKTYSFSKNHRGTSSHHGGVAQWLN